MTPNNEDKWNDALFEQELGAFYKKHYKRLVDLVYRSTGLEDEAEEAVQMVFQRLIEKKEVQKDFIRNPEGYLYRAAINTILNWIDARERHKIDDDDVSTLELAEPRLAPGREANILRVRKILTSMDPEKAELLNLAYVDELSCREIGRLRGMSTVVVMSQLARARRAFKKLYRIQEMKDGTQKGRHERVDRTGFPETSGA